LVGGIPAVGHLVAGQELAYPRGAGRPAMADDLELGHRPAVERPPGLQQRIHHRVELLLGRIPGLEQVIVEIHHVDRVDGGTGVGVGGQQRPPRPGIDVHRLLEELDPVHLRHPVVGQEHRDRFTAQLHLAQRVHGHRPALRPPPSRPTPRARPPAPAPPPRAPGPAAAPPRAPPPRHPPPPPRAARAPPGRGPPPKTPPQEPKAKTPPIPPHPLIVGRAATAGAAAGL